MGQTMKRVLLVLFALAASAGLAWADAPARVGRVSFLDGSVSFAAGGSDTGEPASLNYPLTAGDRLSTKGSSRAEAHVGSTAIRLAADSAMTFEALDDANLQVRLDTGTLSVRVRSLDPGERFEVDTQTASITLDAAGSYRFDQRASGDVTLTVRAGDAEVALGTGTFHVTSEQAVDIPVSNPSAYRISKAPIPDSWDAWVAARDDRENDLVATRYVSREMNGVEDLDEYGSWRIIAGYGPCWVPSVTVVGWAPYHYGRWAWIDPWGWTWIDDEPWGFAPFHYGRWVMASGTWAWVPGPIVVHPVYRPALVRWVGGVPPRDHPPDIHHIRWTPLAPRWPIARPIVRPFAPRPIAGPVPHPIAGPATGGPIAGPVYHGAVPYVPRASYARSPVRPPVPVASPPRAAARDPEIWRWQGRR